MMVVAHDLGTKYNTGFQDYIIHIGTDSEKYFHFHAFLTYQEVLFFSNANFLQYPSFKDCFPPVWIQLEGRM